MGKVYRKMHNYFATSAAECRRNHAAAGANLALDDASGFELAGNGVIGVGTFDERYAAMA